MSASDANKTNATKPAENDAAAPPAPKPAAQLEEDDEFEDFPAEDWTKEEEVGAQTSSTHLWEESWDDNDTTDDFSVQLKAEMERLGSQRKS